MKESSIYVEVAEMSEKARLSRRERDRLRHKEEILTAALKLFAERGFHEVSMQEIAARAEFATGTSVQLLREQGGVVRGAERPLRRHDHRGSGSDSGFRRRRG